jgi:hypothetical protein
VGKVVDCGVAIVNNNMRPSEILLLGKATSSSNLNFNKLWLKKEYKRRVPDYLKY